MKKSETLSFTTHSSESTTTQTRDNTTSFSSTKNNNSTNASASAAPPEGTSPLTKLAWYALGPVAAFITDIIMVLYLVGVIVTYLNAMRSFLADTIFTTGNRLLDSLALIAIMGPLSLVPNTSYLAKASATGLLVLFMTFSIIAWYGYVVPSSSSSAGEDSTTSNNNRPSSYSWQEEESPQPHRQSSTENTLLLSSFWLPNHGISGVSQWFGCVVFGYGIIPLTFSFRNAMQEPNKMVPTTWWAMMAVSVSYIAIGICLLIPFPHIQGDILHELPHHNDDEASWLPTITRLAMVLVVLVTAPLLIVPCGEIIEGKIQQRLCNSSSSSSSSSTSLTDGKQQQIQKIQAGVRWSICLVSAAISAFIPGFVDVLSLVGCCCVAVVGFVIPPLFHLVLSMHLEEDADADDDDDNHEGSVKKKKKNSRIALAVIDMALLIWGMFATVVSTIYTFKEISSSAGNISEN